MLVSASSGERLPLPLGRAAQSKRERLLTTAVGLSNKLGIGTGNEEATEALNNWQSAVVLCSKTDLTAPSMRAAGEKLEITNELSRMEVNTNVLRNCDKVLEPDDEAALRHQHTRLPTAKLARKNYDAGLRGTGEFSGYENGCLGREKNSRGKEVCVARSMAVLDAYETLREEGRGIATHNDKKKKCYLQTIPAIAEQCDWLTYDANSFDIAPAANYGNYEKFCDIVYAGKEKRLTQTRRKAVNKSLTQKSADLQFERFRFDEGGQFKLKGCDPRRDQAGYRYVLLPGQPRFAVKK